MRSVFRLLPLLCLLTLFASCNGLFMDKRTKAVIKSGDGLLRGVELDMTLPQVRAIETDTLVEENASFLGYVRERKRGKDHLEVEYSFNPEGKLDLIMIYYYMEKEEDAKKLVADLKEYFDKKIGASKTDEMGWQVWEYPDKKGLAGNVEIILNKKVDEQGRVVELEIVKYYQAELADTSTTKL
jgi:hypothetical protein